MPTLVRPYEERDREAFFETAALTYNDGLPFPEEEKQIRHGRGYLAEQDGRIGGVFQVLPMNVTRGPASLPCGGIAGVAVLPELRRSGLGSEMMRWAVRHFRDSGVPLAALSGYRESYDRRFGYEGGGKRLQINCPSHRLPTGDGGLPVRRLGPADWRKIDPCYRAFAHARSGLNLRDVALWQRVLGEHKPLAIYAFGDPVESYAAVSHKTEFWSDQHISELVWSTLRGYESALAFLRGIGINKTNLTWFEPSDGPFYARHLDNGIEAQIRRPIMFRVNDVPAALRALRPEGAGEFRVRVRDEVVPENEGPWRVAFGANGVEVEPASDADMELDIQPFAQAFLGVPRLDYMLRSGLVSVQGGEGVRGARARLPALRGCGAEFF